MVKKLKTKNTYKSHTNYQIDSLKKELGKWVKEYIDKGWKCYQLQFTFNPLSGNSDGRTRQMEAEVYLGKFRTVRIAGRKVSKKPARPKLQRIHIQATTDTPIYHTGYGLKTMGKKLPYDHLLILPKSDSERVPREIEVRPHTRIR